jgi:uncharacterized protein YpuA (DUF1002 family)
LIKGRIRETTIKYCSEKKKKENDIIKQLTRDIINDLEEKYIANCTDETKKSIEDKKAKLENISLKHAKGFYITWSKAEYIEGMEKNGKYFAKFGKEEK